MCIWLPKENGLVLKRLVVVVVDFDVVFQGRKGGCLRTWKKHVEDDCLRFGFMRQSVLCWSRWIEGVNKIATKLR